MKVRRGDVIVLDYPFSDGSASKVRPAVVVQGDANNGRLTNTIVALVTKNILRATTEPAHLLIDITTPDGKRSGLRVTSVVTCNNLFTVRETRILKMIGQMPPSMMLRLDDCLKFALGIP